jgi:dipeptidyl aminopeptidase/acylaminoacyl peptidase
VNADHSRLLLIGEAHRTIAQLRRASLVIAGVQLDIQNQSFATTPFLGSFRLFALPSGREIPLHLPSNPLLSMPVWSPDGRHFAFTNAAEQSTALWIGDGRTGVLIKAASGLNNLGNSLSDPPVQWLTGSKQVLFKRRVHQVRDITIPHDTAPAVEDSAVSLHLTRTYENPLHGPDEVRLFERLFTSQVEALDLPTMGTSVIGTPGVYGAISASPDGNYLLVKRFTRPYSDETSLKGFADSLEVWTRNGHLWKVIGQQPASTAGRIDGVRPGPRLCSWISTKPNTLLWVAREKRGPRNLDALYEETVGGAGPSPRTLEFPGVLMPMDLRISERDYPFAFFRGGTVWFDEYLPKNKLIERVQISDTMNPTHIKVIATRPVNDEEANPGVPLLSILPNGYAIVSQGGSDVLLKGAILRGGIEMAFLDDFNLTTSHTERKFQSSPAALERIVAVVADDGNELVTEQESPTMPPHYLLRDLRANKLVELKLARSDSADDSLQFVNLDATRRDGSHIQCRLYLPPHYNHSGPLPALLWIYPLRFATPAEGNRTYAPGNRYLEIRDISPVVMAYHGYAVFDNVGLPVIGDRAISAEDYIAQLRSDVELLISAASSKGLVDPERVAIGGHSYGAFAVAILLAHSRLFRAGIALGGAYNRTLTPFGFQDEKRRLWDDPMFYHDISPFMLADKIKDPFLLMHGASDENPGTVPLQSRMLWEAIVSNGGKARLIDFPYEGHDFLAEESVEDAYFEMEQWLDEWVKP